MANIRDINEELDRLAALRMLVESYQEIAASRMQRIRSSVLENREFQVGLLDIFSHVKNSSKEALRIATSKKHPSKQTLAASANNGLEAHVLLSANAGLYGDIIKNTFDLFMSHIQKGNCQAVIIGRKGLLFYEQEGKTTPHVYFAFPDHKMDLMAFEKIMAYLSSFEKIFVYYGKFENTAVQKPFVTSISGDEPPLSQQDTARGEKYIFEPSISALAAFFQSQFLATGFEQTVYESQLAKFASRMVTLDLAIEHVKKLAGQSMFEKQKVRHRAANAKQISILSGMSLWK